MGHHVQSVLLHDILYVGGGDVVGGDAYGENNFIIMVYDTKLKKWSTLPPYFVINFAMTAANNQLVLAGGDNHWYETTKALFVWKPETNEWSQPFPELPTPRSACSAVGYNSWLIIVGGVSSNFYDQHQDIDLNLPVEVLNTGSKQWHTLSNTPEPWKNMKPALVGDVCYFMGGSEVLTRCSTKWWPHLYNVHGLSLPALLSAVHSADKDTKQMWKEIPKLKFSRASLLSLNGSLLALGGVDTSRYYVVTPSIFLYQSDRKKWQKVADLHEEKLDCTCVVTPDGDLLVAAGFNDRELGNVRVELARLR